MHFTDDEVPNDPGVSPPTGYSDLQTPCAIMQQALVLDSILSPQPPTDLPSLRALQAGAGGTTSDFRDLSPGALSLLSGHSFSPIGPVRRGRTRDPGRS